MGIVDTATPRSGLAAPEMLRAGCAGGTGAGGTLHSFHLLKAFFLHRGVCFSTDTFFGIFLCLAG